MGVFGSDEIAIVPVMNRVVGRCFLLDDDPVTGKNYDHRKAWIEDLLQRFAASFGIDLLGFAILSNPFIGSSGLVRTWWRRGMTRKSLAAGCCCVRVLLIEFLLIEERKVGSLLLNWLNLINL